MPRTRLEERFRSFEAGEWESLVLQSIPGVEQAANVSARRRRRERTGEADKPSKVQRCPRDQAHVGQVERPSQTPA